MKLIIDGQTADLGNSKIAISKKWTDISNPTARFVAITNLIKLPDTNTNRRIFESPKAINSDNRAFNKLYNTIINDVDDLLIANSQLKDVSKDTYTIQAVEETKNVNDNLDILLKDVDWDDKDTELSNTAIDALDSVDTDTCWYWGKACYHETPLQANTDQSAVSADRTKYSRPVFLIQGLLKRVLSNNDYTLTIPEPYLALSSNHKDFFFTSYQKEISFTQSLTSYFVDLDSADFIHSDIGYAASLQYAIDTQNNTEIFRIRGNITSDGEVEGQIIAEDGLGNTKSTTFTINEGTAFYDISSDRITPFTGVGAVTYVRIWLQAATSTEVTWDDVLVYTIQSEDEKDLSGDPYEGYKIKAYDNFPAEITYKDLIKTMSVAFNYFQEVNNNDKTIEFKSLNIENQFETKDWSDKIVIDNVKIETSTTGLAQTNYLKYTNDETVKLTTGQSTFTVDNDSLGLEKDYIVLPFSASYDTEINSNTIVHLSIYEDTKRIEDQELNVRLLYIDSDKLQFGPIHWDSLRANYYNRYFNSFNNLRIVTAEFNLTKSDLIKWDIRQLIYIEYFNMLFIPLELSNYIPGRTTKVKLLRYG